MPDTTPIELTVAIPVEAEAHVPPVTELLNVVVLPRHTVAVPVMAPASAEGLTVTIAVAEVLPQPLVSV
jgi:hypothetical protein